MSDKKVFLTVKDFSVSGKEFQLLHDENLDMLITHPQPLEEELPEFYKSEDYISHTDSKRNLFEKVYHVIRNISLNRKLKLINSFNTESKKILDVGCGTGDFLHTALIDGWSVTGIEPNEDARAIANKKTDNSVYDILKLLELEEESYDVITLWHVLEHLPKLENHIQVFKRLLKPNGKLVIAVPNFKSYDATFYKSYWAAFDVPRHLWHFSKTSISKLFQAYNIVLEKSLPMKFDSFYVALLSEKYKVGWMNIFRAFLIGLWSNLKAKSSGNYSSLIYILKKG